MDGATAGTGFQSLNPTVCCNVCGTTQFGQYGKRSDGVNVIRCSNCGMGVIEEQPPELASLYSDAYYASATGSAHGYADYSYTAEHGVAWAASLIRLLAPRGRVLDIGCADGHLLKKLRPSHECYGIEVNGNMAALCRGAGIEIIGSDIYEPAVSTKYRGFFDVVSAIAVFDHLHDLKSAVEVTLDLLGPAGFLLFEVPLMSSQHPSDVWFKSSLEHIYYPNQQSLKYLFEKVFELPLIGNEIVIEDYGSTFIGLVPKGPDHGKGLLEQYNRLVHGAIAELKPGERSFRFLLDCVHAARTSPEHLDLLKDLDLRDINPALFQRLVSLWRRDTERRDGSDAELGRAVTLLAERDATVWQQECTMAAQERELQIFRTSKLQRLRNVILCEKFSIRKLMKIVYLIVALATPKRIRHRFRPAVQKWKQRVDRFTQRRPKEVKIGQWPKERPLISVVIPCFNYGRYVEEAVESVLSQTFQDFEIIVVDGGSTDAETLSVIRSLQKPKTRVYEREGRHLAGDNRNFGIRQSRGKYICCLDADDRLKPTYLEKALFLLEAYNYDIVSPSIECFGASDLKFEVPLEVSLEQVTKSNQISTVAVFSKDLWTKAGGYHDWGLGKDHVPEDWDLWVRMMALGARAINVSEALMLYRKHQSATLSSQSEAPSFEMQAARIRDFNQEYLSRRNHRLSEKRNAAIFKADDPFKNLMDRSLREPRKPAVLFALPFVITGGADTVLLGVAEHLAKNGFALSVITTIPMDASLGDNSPRYEAITKQIYHLHNFLKDESRWKDFVFYLIASRNIDVLFLAGSAFVYGLLPEIKERFPHIKVVDQLFNEFGHIENNRKYAQYIDLHIVANETIKGILIERFGEDASRIRVVVHGVDVKGYFNPESSEINSLRAPILPKNKFFVSFIGRFSEEKCPDTFVEIAQVLRNEQNFHFLMIGNGPEYCRIKEKIRTYRLDAKFYAPGFVAEMRPYVKMSGVVVIPSKIEGIPIILMESLALGVPVVASKVGGIPSIVGDGFNGFVCEPSDIEGFARNIRQIAADESLRRTLKVNAREYALQHLDVDDTNRAYHDVLLALIRDEGSSQTEASRGTKSNGSSGFDPSRATAISVSPSGKSDKGIARWS
jgi:glycosyltransferase involved in cell wall biosynthesis/SAM-dependent methyltransferase